MPKTKTESAIFQIAASPNAISAATFKAHHWNYDSNNKVINHREEQPVSGVVLLSRILDAWKDPEHFTVTTDASWLHIYIRFTSAQFPGYSETWYSIV